MGLGHGSSGLRWYSNQGSGPAHPLQRQPPEQRSRVSKACAWIAELIARCQLRRPAYLIVAEQADHHDDQAQRQAHCPDHSRCIATTDPSALEH